MAGPSLKLPGGSADGGGRGPYIIAVLINIALIALLSTVLSVPVIYILRNQSGEPPVQEHVTFSVPAAIPPLGGDSLAGRKRAPIPPKAAQPVPVPPPATPPDTPPPTPPVVPTVKPPTEIPAGIAPPRAGDSIASGIGRGIRGLSPGPVDPRLLGLPDSSTPPGSIHARNPSPDSAVHSWVRSYWDSIATIQAAQGNQRSATDWTREIDGKKYGIDPQFIYFGKFRLPTMLLSLLPIYSAGNPTAWERNRQLESMRSDIMFQAARAANEDDFRAAVKALRERKEQEHQAELKRKAEAAAKPKPPER